MAVEHVIVGKESAPFTWTTPSKAIPVTSFKGAVNRSMIDGRYSGLSRGVYGRWQGAKEPSGSMSMPLWGELMGLFLMAAQLQDTGSATPAGATTAKEHGFLPGDALALSTLSIQAQHGPSHAVNYLGVIIDKLTLACKAGEIATLSMDWKARDEALAGVGTWDYDGVTASPALIASPTYFSRTIPPFVFTGASLLSGGSCAVDPTSKVMTVSGGTAVGRIESAEISLENQADLPVYLGAPTPGGGVAQARTIAVTFDQDQSVIDPQFYSDYRNGQQTTLELKFAGPIIEAAIRRRFSIVLPLVSFDEADWSEITGSRDRRSRSVKVTAIVDPTLGVDIGASLIDTQASY